MPGGVLNEPRLGGVGELPRHDFGVGGVGDARGVVAGDQAEVADVLEVMGREVALAGAAQQRIDDASHAVFLELVGELVEVDLPALNKMLPGVEDVGGGDRAGSVAPRLVVEADFAAQRVHQPWLAPGLRPHRIERLRGERLSGLRGVLGEQRVHLGSREVAESERFGFRFRCSADLGARAV